MGRVVVKDLQQTFAGRRVLVTGHTGFKGSWLSLWLEQLGAMVTGFALPPRGPHDHFVEAGIASRVSHVVGDVRDAVAVARTFEEAQPEFVFHLAAQALVRQSYDDPKTTFDVNVGGTVNVLEAARLTPSVRAFVCVTSDKCYRNQEWIWGYRESDELGGFDPYSASKAAAEIVAGSYAAALFAGRAKFGFATARAGNVIGGGDWAPDRIVPDFIRAGMSGTPLMVRRPEAVRPWQHVLEPLGGYLWLAHRLRRDPARFGGSWNFGPRPGHLATVRTLIERAQAHWGDTDVVFGDDTQGMHETGILALNIDKAEALLDWHPRWDFERTVLETIEWYKQRAGATSGVAALSERQIQRYVENEEA